MKILSFLLPGTISLGTALLLLGAPMLAAHAQNSTVVAQAGDRKADRPNLNLTADQKAKMKAIRESTRRQIESILTADQKAQLETERSQGTKRRPDWRSLNLTAEQKAQMKSIRQASEKQIESVLTPTQLEQMRQFREQHRRNKPAQEMPSGV